MATSDIISLFKNNLQIARGGIQIDLGVNPPISIEDIRINTINSPNTITITFSTRLKRKFSSDLSIYSFIVNKVAYSPVAVKVTNTGNDKDKIVVLELGTLDLTNPSTFITRQQILQGITVKVGKNLEGIAAKNLANHMLNSLPTISSINLASDNNYIDITFSENVINEDGTNLSFTDFDIVSTNNNISASSAAPPASPAIPANTTRISLTRNNYTLDGTETLTINPAVSSTGSRSKIKDLTGNYASIIQSNNQTGLNDETIVQSVNINPDNGFITVNFRESVLNERGANAAWLLTDFNIGGLNNSITPILVPQSGSISSIRINLTFKNYTPDGSETIIINPATSTSNPSKIKRSNQVEGRDIYASTNQAGTNNKNQANLHDKMPPSIASIEIGKNNEFMDVVFSEAVYHSNHGTGILDKENFELELKNGSSSSSVDITGINGVDESTGNEVALAEGASKFRLKFSYTHTINGTEILTVKPKVNSIFDRAGNAASVSQSNNSANLKASATS